MGTVVVLCLFSQIFGLESGWRYERNAIAAGEWWRLLSGHFVHLNAAHLVFNVFGLLVALCLFGGLFSARAWMVLTLATSLATGVGLWLLSPTVVWYVGFSGTLHGLFAAGGLRALLVGDRIGLAALLMIGGKLFWEQLYGEVGTSALIGAAVVVDSHLYGFLGGLMATLAHRACAKIDHRARGAIS